MPELSDSDLERDILRAVLAQPKTLHALERVPTAADFGTSIHRSTWQVLWDLDSDETRISPEVVCAELRRRRAPKAAEYVERAAAQPRVASDAMPELVARLLTLSRMRQLWRAATDAANAVEVAESLEAAEAAVEAILRKGDDAHASMHHMGAVARKLVEDARSDRPSSVAASTGLSAVDAIMRGGYRRGHITVVGARPGVGKSALVGASGMRAAVAGASVAVFSLEMTRRDWVERCLQELTQSESAQIGSEGLRVKIDGAVAAMEGLRAHIDDRSGLSVETIRSECRRLKSRVGLDVVFVDYAQLSRTEKRTQSREREVAEVSQGLLGIAKDLDIAVVAVAQLNRGVESRPDKRPGLGDLRDSGQLEQDAHEVWMLYQHSKYAEVDAAYRDTIELHVVKNRGGCPTLQSAPVLLRFQGATMQWESVPSVEWFAYYDTAGLAKGAA